MRLLVAVHLFLFGLAFGAPAQVRPATRMTDEDIAAIFHGISQQAARVQPMLQQLHPADWVAKGAPETYVAQWNSSLQELTGIQTEMSALAQHPNRMTDAMKALFRVQASHQLLASLMGGLRRYQNPALADLIESVAAGDGAGIEQLQQYLLTLAEEKEQQFDVVTQEAQRCRGMLSRQPAPQQPRR